MYRRAPSYAKTASSWRDIAVLLCMTIARHLWTSKVSFQDYEILTCFIMSVAFEICELWRTASSVKRENHLY